MPRKEVVLKNKTGLHARPASEFVQKANSFVSNINIIKDDKKYNAKSIISILSMGAGKDTKLIIDAEGDDSQEAVEALVALVKSGFGEL